MRLNFRLLLTFLLWALLATTALSCARLAKNDFPSHEMRYFDDTPVGQSRAYKEYKTLVPGEKARISYLLWRMEYSNLHFWRNGSTYAGRDGAGWLRWKMRKFYPDVKTVGEFISQVASRSERSRQPYRVSCAQYNDFHDLSSVLTFELLALDVYERSQTSVAVNSLPIQEIIGLPQEEKGEELASENPADVSRVESGEKSEKAPEMQEAPAVSQASSADHFSLSGSAIIEEVKDSREVVPVEKSAG